MNSSRLLGFISALVLGSAEARACATNGKAPSAADLAWTREKYLQNRQPAAAPRRAGPMPRLPQYPGERGQIPWGGQRPTEWSDEALLANATSQALNEAWSRLATKDVIVAVPVSMTPSGLRPYGDGQTNAGVKFPDWPHKVPPVVATLIRQSRGTDLLHLRVHESLAVKGAATITYFVEQPVGSKNFQKKTAGRTPSPSTSGTPSTPKTNLRARPAEPRCRAVARSGTPKAFATIRTARRPSTTSKNASRAESSARGGST